MAEMSTASDSPQAALRVTDLKAEFVSSNPNSPFVKDGYRSEDMHDQEVNDHIDNLMSFATNMDDGTPGQTSGEEQDEEFSVSDGQGGFVVNLQHSFEGTDDRISSSTTGMSPKESPKLLRMKELAKKKAARDRRRRKEKLEEEESQSFWSWCCAGSRATEDSATGSAPQEHK